MGKIFKNSICFFLLCFNLSNCLLDEPFGFLKPAVGVLKPAIGFLELLISFLKHQPDLVE